MKKHLSFIAMTAIMFFGYSQETTTTEAKFESEVPTVDRGAYTRPAQNIKKGLQIELGTNYEWTDSHNDVFKTDLYSPIQGKLRIGLSDRVELDFAINNQQMIVRSWDGTYTDKYNYWTPMDIGVRTQLLDSKKKCATDIALYIGMSVNTTQRSAMDDNGNVRPWVLVDRPSYVTPEFALFVNHNIGDRLVLGYNGGLKWTGRQYDQTVSRMEPDWFYTVRLLAHATTKFDVYAEHFNYIRRTWYPTLGMNFGARYAISEKFVADVNGGFGFNKKSPDAFVGLGISYKLGK